MIKTIIIDDEQNSREALENLVKSYCPDLHVVSSAASVEEGIKVIKSEKPDLVFLDIEMPDKSGFDLLSQLGTIDFEVIITTGYEQYAVKAFKTVALDYLLKPIDINELELAVAKVLEKRKKRKVNKIYLCESKGYYLLQRGRSVYLFLY